MLKEGEDINESFKNDIKILDRIYVDITIYGSFNPELIDRLSKEWEIPQNYMFISSFGKNFLYQISDLGGVRLII